MANNDPRPLYDAPIVPAGVTVLEDGTIIISDDDDFNPERDGADADVGRPPAPPAPLRPGFHPDVGVRLDSYANELPGNWNVESNTGPVSELRGRAAGVYWDGRGNPLRAATVWRQNRLQNTGYKLLGPPLQDDVRLIASAFKDDRIGNMSPLIVTAKRDQTLLKSDIAHFMRSNAVIEYRMMDALFAAVASIPDVRGPRNYDYGRATRADTVAMPAITWDHILRKFQYLEGEGPPPTALPEYMPGFIDPSTSQVGDPTNVHPTIKAAHSILFPILLEGRHWVFAFINYGRRTTLVVNSDHNAANAQQVYRTVEKYLHYWMLQNLSGEPTNYPNAWDIRRIPGPFIGQMNTVQTGGVLNVLGAIFLICNVDPTRLIQVVPTDIRAFLAAALSQGGFRGAVYFPHQDARGSRPWSDWFKPPRSFWSTLGRPIDRTMNTV